ncbi:MAG: Lrp/AsnC family transcriptional regulator [archaeon]
MQDKSEQILEFLKKNSRLSLREIAKKAGIPLTTAHNRIKKMQKEGIIKNYSVEIDYSKLGFSLCAYILALVNYNVKHSVSQQEIAKKILHLGFVETVDIITGEFDLLIKVRTKNVQQLNKFITKELRNIEGIDKTTTMIVLEEIN